MASPGPELNIHLLPLQHERLPQLRALEAPKGLSIPFFRPPLNTHRLLSPKRTALH